MVEAYESGDRQRAAELAPVELMREIFLFGSPEQIKQRLEQFVAGGITTCVLTLMAPPDQIPGLIDALAR
jgi:alkanesulfonate monooxygenase SsuD/methylene tetrahydromethanopterin reductase-like flavin-dependent oxidoreductase (luciferase family)